MNTTEAKFILQARRPDGRDDAEPQFTEALEQARRDPALTEWLAREQAFDMVVADKLRSVQPPAGLREAILAGARMSRPVPFWRRPQVLALAASVVIIFGLVAVWPALRPASDTERLAMGVMTEVNSAAHHAAMPSPRGELRTLLTAPGTRLAAGLPLDMNQLKSDGCRSLSIAGHNVVEVCFERGGEFHLYVANRSDFKGDGEPMFRERGNLASVAWTDTRHAYVLVTSDGAASLRNVF
ncbi:MAG: hypothetical protein WC205_13915 [Opitutaceae bacterium]|jgi:hypothetical protein